MSTCLAVAKEQMAGSPDASAPVVGEGWQGATMGHILEVQHLHQTLPSQDMKAPSLQMVLAIPWTLPLNQMPCSHLLLCVLTTGTAARRGRSDSMPQR